MMILLIAQEIMIMRNYSAYILKRPLKGRKKKKYDSKNNERTENKEIWFKK